MKASSIPRSIVLGILASLLVAGSAGALEIITEEDIIEGVILEHHLVPVVKNAVFMLDSSSSQARQFEDTGESRWHMVREFLKARNSYFPNIGIRMGIYRYTPWTVVYPLEDYSRDGVAAALETLPADASGATPLRKGLEELEKILQRVSGTTAVFLFTDGTYSAGVGSLRPIHIAERLADTYDVCFYVISTAEEDINHQLLDRVAALNACSRLIPFENFINNPAYVTGALFDVKATETPITFTEKRVVGAKVDDLTFRFDKASLLEEDKQELEAVIAFLQSHPEAWVRIAGHTDNVGSDEVNLELSRRRAETVEQLLMFNGVDQSRIVTHWYGSANPIATNDTPEGRALNRRVEMAIGM
jgi:OOP family OmpA-OmpF porin